jgi:hypothetical protein
MSRKYVSQVDSLDFVYPNNFTAEYDLEIIHDINDNCVSGNVTVFSATTISTTGITFNIQGDWSLNNAEPYININGGLLSVASIHMLGPTQSYYRPWRLINNISSTGLTNTYITINENFTALPSMLGLTGFTTGTYYFEVRMIGKKCVYPICVTLPITMPAPPTPTPTPTATPTPTPTPTPPPTPCVCVEIEVEGTGPENFASIQYNDCTGTLVNEVFMTDGTRYRCIDYTGGEVQIFEYDNLTYNIASGFSCSLGTCPVDPTPTPTITPEGCTCYCMTYVVEGFPLTLNVRYRDCVSDTTITTPIWELPSFDNGDGTATACICVKQGGAYAIPVCVSGGIEVTCDPYTWVEGGACTTAGSECFGPAPTATPTPTATSTPTPTPTSTGPTPTPTPTPTSTSTPTPTPTETPLDCLCFCYTYTTVPSDLSVRWRDCSSGEVDIELIQNLEQMDNGDGTFTACLCVRQGSSYATPVCVQGGIEVTCPDTWVSGSTCDGLVGPCFIG